MVGLQWAKRLHGFGRAPDQPLPDPLAADLPLPDQSFSEQQTPK
jgi:hypothetical protein